MNKNQFEKRYVTIGSSVNIIELTVDHKNVSLVMQPSSPVQLISTVYVDRLGFAIEVMNQ
jgi:hypothetical protein